MHSAPVRVLVLGSPQCWVGARRLQLFGPRHVRLLAALALDVGRTVSINRLVEAIWDGDPPATARRQVQDLFYRLRRGLLDAGADRDVLVSERDGYRLDAAHVQTDALQFERTVAAAERETSPDREAAALRGALALWRGPALDGVEGRALAALATAWEERRAVALERCLAVELDLGSDNAGRLVPELIEFVNAYPLRERPTYLLMQALASSGRRAEALDAYSRYRGRLADELGLDPGPDLQLLHRSTLRAESVESTPEPLTVSPAQLPADNAAFTGRAEVLQRLDALLASPAKAAIIVISGTAGVGKTTLAVRWAHRIAARFPDGQLHVNLRGFDASGSVTPPAQAIRDFLDALGVPPGQLPASHQAQVALFRRLTAGRRLLVLLDNARDAAQVRPLLPALPGSLVVVTSRSRLAGLVAVEGAQPVVIDTLNARESRDLLAARLTDRRLAGEPAAVDEIVDWCAGLPLALTVVAVRAAVNPYFELGDLADQLRKSERTLDGFVAADPGVEVRAVFSWSYRALSEPAARLFRLLGQHPGPDIGDTAVASLAGTSVDAVRPLLVELADANLVNEHSVGRYSMHDLLCAYAGELVERVDSEADRQAATGRVLDHYLHTANAAAMLLSPQRNPIDVGVPGEGVTLEHLSDAAAAFDWCYAERPALLRAVEHAAAHRYDRHAWQLVWSLSTFLDRIGQWTEWERVQRLALAAADRLGDRTGRAHTHRLLARVCGELGQSDQALEHYERAIDLFGQTGDLLNRGGTYLNRTGMYAIEDDEPSLADSYRALEDFVATGYMRGQGAALNNVAWHLARLGDLQAALVEVERSLHLYQQMSDDHHGMACTRDTLAYIHCQLGNHALAIEQYTIALELRRSMHARFEEGETLDALGDAYAQAGELDTARKYWRDALEILLEVDRRAAAEKISAKLER